MKKLLVVLGILAFVLRYTLAAQAQTKFTFDDIPASNGGFLLQEEYSAQGVHFLHHPTMPSVVQDGYVYDSANAPFGSAFSGNQFVIMHALGGNGIVIKFDNPVDSASYQVLSDIAAPSVLNVFFWNGIPDTPGFIDQGGAVNVHPGSGSGWRQFDSSAASGPFDYLLIVSLAGNNWALDDLVVTGLEGPPPTFEGTGIQITGTSSNIMTKVMAGDTVQFTVNAVVMGGAEVNYRFFTRVGYGQPDWGGNKWQIVQPYSPNNTVSLLFDTPGVYFLVGHVEYPGETWEFGDPQSGIVVEVWPTQ